MAKDTCYVSETTNFIGDFLKQHPEIIKKQSQLRKTWWDLDHDAVDIDIKLQKENIPNDAYVYFTYSKQL